jgi:hypothetical protein
MVFPRCADSLFGVRMDQFGRTWHWRVGWVWRANGLCPSYSFIWDNGLFFDTTGMSFLKIYCRPIYPDSNQGELAHRLVKRLYGLTNKKNAVQQISKKYSRQQSFQRHPEEQEQKEANEGVGRLSDHHIISRSRNERLDLFSFSRVNGDPAKKV